MDSAIVKIIPKSLTEIRDIKYLQLFIKEIFNYRNKTLRNGIKLFLKRGNKEIDFGSLNENTKTYLQRKIKTLSLEEIITIIDDIKKNSL